MERAGVRWSIVTLKGAVKMSFIALNSHSVNISFNSTLNMWSSTEYQHSLKTVSRSIQHFFLKVPHFGRFPHRWQLVQAFSFSPPQVNQRSRKLHERSEGSRTLSGGGGKQKSWLTPVWGLLWHSGALNHLEPYWIFPPFDVIIAPAIIAAIISAVPETPLYRRGS